MRRLVGICWGGSAGSDLEKWQQERRAQGKQEGSGDSMLAVTHRSSALPGTLGSCYRFPLKAGMVSLGGGGCAGYA